MARLFNYIGLLSGYLLGAGAFFLAQSYLAFIANYQALGEIALGIGISSTLLILVDWGSTSLFSKSLIDKSKVDLSVFIAWVLTRFLIALVVGTLFFYWEEPVVGLWNLPICMAWALNARGVIDALGLNGTAGIYSSFNQLFASVYVIAASYYGILDYYYIGYYYLCGTALTVMIQLLIVGKHIDAKQFSKIGFKQDFIWSLHNGFYFFFNGLVNQGYGRLLQWAAIETLGTIASGQYIYLRNMFLFGCQFIGFAIRTDLPKTRFLQRFTFFSVAKCFKATSICIIIMLIAYVALYFSPFLEKIDIEKFGLEYGLLTVMLLLASLSIVIESFYLLWGQGGKLSAVKTTANMAGLMLLFAVEWLKYLDVTILLFITCEVFTFIVFMLAVIIIRIKPVT